MMRTGIHPDYRTVVFHDTSSDTYFAVGSTMRTDRTIEWEGREMPYVAIEISSASHPYYTGKQKEFSKEGSTARFQQRFGRFLTPKSA